ncbi:MAG: peptidoglycan DD-metalloendopeptidase family protein [Bacteroidales bacterium]|nr:peptidoglycan DD-metalloendopeptidase family protein [Bacteroidales bacterium]
MIKHKGIKIIGLLLLGGVMGISLLLSACKTTPTQAVASTPVESAIDTIVPATDDYGIPMDLYNVEEGKVGRNQTLSDLLQPLGVSLQEIYQISLLPDSLVNERKIKQGNPYLFYSLKDAHLEVPRNAEAIFIYEKDQLNFVAISIDPDSIWARNGRKPVDTRQQVASGIIETSLWESMLAADANPMLAIELSEIFAWTIDFFGLQQGDQYKVIYEESFVDSSSIGIDRITGAWICHNETDFWAIPFVQDSIRSFFDEEGNSLRKAFLKAPLRFSRISSGFSHSRYHPVLKIRRPHHGVDYAAPTGTPVHTVGDGVITKVGYQKGGGGNYVKIKHNSVYSTTYMHLSGFGKGVRQGVYVKQGDVIGYVGSSGLATGPHLDFRFYKNGSAVNPLKVEAPPVEPVYEKNRRAYGLIRVFTISWLKLLQ